MTDNFQASLRAFSSSFHNFAVQNKKDSYETNKTVLLIVALAFTLLDSSSQQMETKSLSLKNYVLSPILSTIPSNNSTNLSYILYFIDPIMFQVPYNCHRFRIPNWRYLISIFLVLVLYFIINIV